MNQEPTNTEILKAITEGQKHTDARIDEILEVVSEFSTKMDKDVAGLKTDVAGLKTDVAAIKATLTTMPTRDDMNEALANTKADIILTMRKEDMKLRELISVLSGKNVLTQTEVKRILSMEPFPQLYAQ